MATILNFIKKLQNGVTESKREPWSDNANKYRFVKKAEFEIQWMFNNAAIIGNTPVLKTLNPENISIVDSSTNINNSALTEDSNFYVISVDLDNLVNGDVINIGKQYSELGNPGINAVVLADAMTTPQEYSLKITFRDTMNSPVDNFITQWMYYNSSPKGYIPESIKENSILIGAYEQRLTANIQIRLIRYFEVPNCNGTGIFTYKQIFRTYMFEGVFPITVDNPNVSNDENDFITRDIGFAFSRFKLINRTEVEDATEEVSDARRSIASMK